MTDKLRCVCGSENWKPLVVVKNKLNLKCKECGKVNNIPISFVINMNDVSASG